MRRGSEDRRRARRRAAEANADFHTLASSLGEELPRRTPPPESTDDCRRGGSARASSGDRRHGLQVVAERPAAKKAT